MSRERSNVEILVGEGDVIHGGGRLIKKIQTHNLFVTNGRNLLRNHFSYPDCSSDGFTPQFIGIGSSGSTPTAGQTVLVDEVFRKVITRKIPTAAAQVMFELYIDQTEANDDPHQDLREIGLFTLASGGDMWARAVHDLIEKTDALWVIYRWYFTFTAS